MSRTVHVACNKKPGVILASPIVHPWGYLCDKAACNSSPARLCIFLSKPVPDARYHYRIGQMTKNCATFVQIFVGCIDNCVNFQIANVCTDGSKCYLFSNGIKLTWIIANIVFNRYKIPVPRLRRSCSAQEIGGSTPVLRLTPVPLISKLKVLTTYEAIFIPEKTVVFEVDVTRRREFFRFFA